MQSTQRPKSAIDSVSRNKKTIKRHITCPKGDLVSKSKGSFGVQLVAPVSKKNMFSDHCRTLGSHLEIRRGHLVAGSPKIHIVH